MATPLFRTAVLAFIMLRFRMQQGFVCKLLNCLSITVVISFKGQQPLKIS
jgi:hypothetical protein